jgi:hypothetical protein
MIVALSKPNLLSRPSHCPETDAERPLSLVRGHPGPTRPDLARRREIKFMLRGADLAKVRRVLTVNCRPLIHRHPVSIVRSLYFDDFRLSACRANLDGLAHRQKLRLRWYDELQPGSDLFLELKWRANRITGKHRLPLQASRSIAELPFQRLGRHLREVVPETWQRSLIGGGEPVLVVEYHREHFVSRQPGLRITLDYHFTYYEQLGRQALRMSFPRRLPGIAVLEGKTPVGRESELRELLHPLKLRATRCSKYVLGCQYLGLIKE